MNITSTNKRKDDDFGHKMDILFQENKVGEGGGGFAFGQTFRFEVRKI